MDIYVIRMQYGVVVTVDGKMVVNTAGVGGAQSLAALCRSKSVKSARYTEFTAPHWVLRALADRNAKQLEAKIASTTATLNRGNRKPYNRKNTRTVPRFESVPAAALLAAE